MAQFVNLLGPLIAGELAKQTAYLCPSTSRQPPSAPPSSPAKDPVTVSVAISEETQNKVRSEQGLASRMVRDSLQKRAKEDRHQTNPAGKANLESYSVFLWQRRT